MSEKCKIQVMNVDSSIGRWRDISKDLNETGVKYERSSAIVGKQVQLINLSNNETFVGEDLKLQPHLLQKNITYQIICPSDLSETVQFKYNTKEDLLVSGEIGIYCTIKVLIKKFSESNCSTLTILEDDFKPAIKTFSHKLDSLHENIPKDAAVVYIDVRIAKGHKIPLYKDSVISKFSYKANYWGTQAWIITKLGAKIFNSIDMFHTTIDNYLLQLARGDLKGPEKFNAYVASHNFSRVDSIEYSGHSPNSEISQSGCRTSLKKKGLDCTNEVARPIENDNMVVNDKFLENCPAGLCSNVTDNEL